MPAAPVPLRFLLCYTSICRTFQWSEPGGLCNIPRLPGHLADVTGNSHLSSSLQLVPLPLSPFPTPECSASSQSTRGLDELTPGSSIPNPRPFSNDPRCQWRDWGVCRRRKGTGLPSGPAPGKGQMEPGTGCPPLGRRGMKAGGMKAGTAPAREGNGEAPLTAGENEDGWGRFQRGNTHQPRNRQDVGNSCSIGDPCAGVGGRPGDGTGGKRDGEGKGETGGRRDRRRPRRVRRGRQAPLPAGRQEGEAPFSAGGAGNPGPGPGEHGATKGGEVGRAPRGAGGATRDSGELGRGARGG